jgi:hypothetical protein
VKLTKEQSKMVIEFFAQQAAQEAPHHEDTAEWDKHIWMTNYEASLAVERKINEHDWAVLVLTAVQWQSFDRDPYGYLNERGYNDTARNAHDMKHTLQDVLSTSIDTAFNTSKAA